ncbi:MULTISPECIES: GtrA family protein [unclassified Romboutsia]|uniref:GtrA family protein n=1 Tax=unclassified Romboutsia TaxID=2626894 RepID=UPI00082154F8|nr:MULTISPECIES: GtrA family protein [unclassified Romboutsia]SCH92230.1 GtrA-like protein [uncultured Clostridium sp.]
MSKHFSIQFSNLKSKFIEYIKFNIVGISNFWISQFFYLMLFLKFKINYLVSYTIVSVISISASYFLNSKYTFKNSKLSLKKFLLTFLVYIFEYILNMGVIIFMVNILGISKVFAPMLAPVISTIPIFFLMKFVINNQKLQ